MATQELAQKVCQKYGWSARFEKEPIDDNNATGNASTTYWTAFVTVGLRDERKFVSDDHESPPDTVDGKKKGIAAASNAALIGLREEIAKQESKERKELTEVFPLYPTPPSSSDSQNNSDKRHQKPRFFIKGSSQRNWDEFIWKKKPTVVGIDAEGNSLFPPVLVQIATNECVILEITSMLGNQLSSNLQRLLADNSIKKVFCDNFAHHDKISLGLIEDKNADIDFSTGPIVDLEVMAAKVLGPVKTPRGLSRIVTLVMPELNTLIGKPPPKKGKRFKDVGRFTLIEQGKAPPIASLRELSHREKLYAAMDAWATLQAYERLSREN